MWATAQYGTADPIFISIAAKFISNVGLAVLPQQ
jgi:hypothetical protein